jgi:hypothetical protein
VQPYTELHGQASNKGGDPREEAMTGRHGNQHAASRAFAQVRRRWRWIALCASIALTGLVLAYLPGKSNPIPAAAQPRPGASVNSPEAELPPGQSGHSAHSARPKHPGAGGHAEKLPTKGPIQVVVNEGKVRVCSLITRQQVDQIMGRRLPPPLPETVGTFKECITTQRNSNSSHAAQFHVAWAVPPEAEPALAFKDMTINLPRSDAVQGMGSEAYCSSKGTLSSQLVILDGHHLLEVFADTCSHAAALAQVALSRL